MADYSFSFFDRKWRHHDITSIVNGNYVLANFSVILANWWNLDSANKFNNVTLCLVVGNDEFIILSNLRSLSFRHFSNFLSKVLEGKHAIKKIDSRALKPWWLW